MNDAERSALVALTEGMITVLRLVRRPRDVVPHDFRGEVDNLIGKLARARFALKQGASDDLDDDCKAEQ